MLGLVGGVFEAVPGFVGQGGGGGGWLVDLVDEESMVVCEVLRVVMRFLERIRRFCWRLL